MAESVTGLLARPIAQAEIDAYQKDGVVCLRGVFSPEWVEKMRAGFELAKQERGPLAQCYKEKGDAGEFFFDVDVWSRLAPFRDFVLESPAGEIAATLMKSSFARLFYDQVFIKEPGEVAPTPWHQDQPYWQVDGKQVCTVWMPLDVVPKETVVEFVAGSHRIETMFSPIAFSEGNAPYDTSMPPVPDIEGHREDYDLVGWDVEPGDCLVFQAMILHGAHGGSHIARRRRALATRWVGDDARFVVRANKTNIPTFESGLKPGDPIAGPMFPEAWPRRGA